MGASGSTQKPTNASPSTNGSMNALKMNAPVNASANVAKNNSNANNSNNSNNANNSNVKVGGKRKKTRKTRKTRKNRK